MIARMSIVLLKYPSNIRESIAACEYYSTPQPCFTAGEEFRQMTRGRSRVLVPRIRPPKSG